MRYTRGVCSDSKLVGWQDVGSKSIIIMHLAPVKCEDNFQGLLRSSEASVNKTAVLDINGIVTSSTWTYVTHYRNKAGTFVPSTQQITTKISTT